MQMLAPGFADPVQQSQSVFRAILDAMSRPGLAQDLPLGGLRPPDPLTPGLAAVALTLADADAPLWLDPQLARTAAVSSYLRFHTGAPIVAKPRDAAFALVADAASVPTFADFAQGTDEYPDRSTTLVLQVPAFVGGPPLTLSGPGIRGHMTLTPTGLPADIAVRLRDNGALFPLGVDLLLVAPRQVVGIPRSTAVEEAD